MSFSNSSTFNKTHRSTINQNQRTTKRKQSFQKVDISLDFQMLDFLYLFIQLSLSHSYIYCFVTADVVKNFSSIIKNFGKVRPEWKCIRFSAFLSCCRGNNLESVESGNGQARRAMFKFSANCADSAAEIGRKTTNFFFHSICVELNKFKLNDVVNASENLNVKYNEHCLVEKNSWSFGLLQKLRLEN